MKILDKLRVRYYLWLAKQQDKIEQDEAHIQWLQNLKKEGY